MRLAWFSPMPPVRTGIATDSAELVRALSASHEVDVYVDESASAQASARSAFAKASARQAVTIRSAHDFVWTQQQSPYDLTIYQVGNSSHHDYLWPYLVRYPGLTVLHDVHLHHARAAALLRERRADDYRAEFAANEPDVNPDAAELAIAGFDSFLYYEWPFTRLAISASRATAVHGRVMRDELGEKFPDARIEHIRLGHGTAVAASAIAARRARARRQHGIPPEGVVFGCFGGLTPDKRLPQILDAFSAILPSDASVWLLLAGAEAEHYDVAADVARRRLEQRVVLTGYLETDDELTDCIAASDVTLNLRWPTAREMSGPWLRCLAAGRASIVIDLWHTSDLPTLDPRTWTPTAADGSAPVAVAIDILDEDHSLRVAMRRLAVDAALRDTLGAAARRYWAREHSHDAMIEDYQRVIDAAASFAPPAMVLPPHLTDTRSEVLTGILGTLGVPVPWGKI